MMRLNYRGDALAKAHSTKLHAQRMEAARERADAAGMETANASAP